MFMKHNFFCYGTSTFIVLPYSNTKPDALFISPNEATSYADYATSCLSHVSVQEKKEEKKQKPGDQANQNSHFLTSRPSDNPAYHLHVKSLFSTLFSAFSTLVVCTI